LRGGRGSPQREHWHIRNDSRDLVSPSTAVNVLVFVEEVKGMNGILLERGFRGVPAGCFDYARHSRHQTSAFDPGVEH
jgi:hypothetical protein